MGILETSAFAVRSMYHNKKVTILGQLVFVKDMIIPINKVVYWRYIRQRKQTQINKDENRENTTIIE